MIGDVRQNNNMHDSFFWLILVLALVFALKIISGFIPSFKTSTRSYEYVPQYALFSDGELAFLEVLRAVVPKTHTIMGKVRFADIVTPAPHYKGKEYMSAFNSISSKHVDFVLCERVTYRIDAILELDDKSHTLAKREKRDAFLDKVLPDAGIPVVHFKASAHYDHQQIREAITTVLPQSEQPPRT